MNPLVCVCVPCFNNEATIRETLDSILSQNYDNFLVKVFDNASTDGSVAIIKEFSEKFDNLHMYQSEKNVTGEENFTKCIENAEGEYSAIFHSDDVYHADMLIEQVAFLEKNKSCGAAATKASIIDADGHVTSNPEFPQELIAKECLALNQEELADLVFKYGNFVCCPSVMFRTTVLKNHVVEFKGYRYKTSSDLDVWFRVTGKFKFGFIDKPLISYRVSPVSYSYNMARTRIDDSDMFIVLDDYLAQIQGTVRYDKLKGYRDIMLARDRYATNMIRVKLGVGSYQDVKLLRIVLLFFSGYVNFKLLIKVFVQNVFFKVPFHSHLINKLNIYT